MKLIVLRSNFRDCISVVEKATGENLNLPILKNVLIQTRNNKIEVISTNLEIAMSCSLSGKIIEEGKLTVPAGVLSSLINNIQSERLNLEAKGSKLEIKTDNYQASIQGLPADDFPITPKVKNLDNFIEIKADVLGEALNQVLVASQFSDLRPELNSALFSFSLNELKIVATDSFRLAEKTIAQDQFKSNHKEDFKIMIPLRTAQELQRIAKNEEVLRIYHDENQILFKTDRIEFLSRLVDGNFPDYTAIVPKKFTSELVLDRKEFLGALKLASIFGSRNSEVKISITENKKAIKVCSSDQAVGENTYVLPAKVKGKVDEVTFNWRYIADVLKFLKTEDIFLGINGDNEPAAIKPMGDGSYFYILKPIVSS